MPCNYFCKMNLGSKVWSTIADILFNHDTARRIAVEGGKNLAKQYDSKLKIMPLNKLK